jgi:hypothetical protein
MDRKELDDPFPWGAILICLVIYLIGYLAAGRH